MNNTDLKLSILESIDELSSTVVTNIDQFHYELMTDKEFRAVIETLMTCLGASLVHVEAIIADINNADNLPFNL